MAKRGSKPESDYWQDWEPHYIKMGLRDAGKWHEIPETNLQVMFRLEDPMGSFWIRKRPKGVRKTTSVRTVTEAPYGEEEQEGFLTDADD